MTMAHLMNCRIEIVFFKKCLIIHDEGSFLDRDGVINEDYGHVFKIKDFVFISGIFELIKKAYDLNMKIFVITNQAGIGRGFYDEEDFKILNKWMC